MPPVIEGGVAPREKERITLIVAFSMIALAIALDGTQDLLLFLVPIPVIGFVLEAVGSWFISFLAAAVFGIWFALRGVSYFSGKKASTKMLIALSSVVIELIPLLDALPAITFGVVALIIQTRIEDKGMTGLQVKRLARGAGEAARNRGLRGAGEASGALGLQAGDNGR